MPRTGRPRIRAEPVGIKAAEQAFDVLDALARAARPRSLMELCADTGMESSKLHRYMVSLCNKGMAQRLEEAKLYTLGPAALSLGVLSLAQLDEFGVLRATVAILSEELRETSFIYVWSHAGPVLLYNQVPVDAQLSIRLGSIAPIFGSAAGPVFIAHMLETLTEPLLIAHAEKARLDVNRAIDTLRNETCPRIRADGIYWSDVTLIPGIAACAAPVFDARGGLIAVIGASSRGLVHPDEQVRRRVRAAAEQASASLGFQSAKARPEPK